VILKIEKASQFNKRSAKEENLRNSHTPDAYIQNGKKFQWLKNRFKENMNWVSWVPLSGQLCVQFGSTPHS